MSVFVEQESKRRAGHREPASAAGIRSTGPELAGALRGSVRLVGVRHAMMVD